MTGDGRTASFSGRQITYEEYPASSAIHRPDVAPSSWGVVASAEAGGAYLLAGSSHVPMAQRIAAEAGMPLG